MNKIFRGRGGAVIVLVNTDLYLTFNFSDNIVMNNSAEVFAGGVYCLTQISSPQTYTFNNNTFVNNTGLQAGGLGLFYATEKPTIAIHTDIHKCSFYNNTAFQKGGAALVISDYELPTNVSITFKECNFFNNAAMVHGGAVDVASFNRILAEPLIALVNWLVKNVLMR